MQAFLYMEMLYFIAIHCKTVQHKILLLKHTIESVSITGRE